MLVEGLIVPAALILASEVAGTIRPLPHPKSFILETIWDKDMRPRIRDGTKDVTGQRSGQKWELDNLI